ncbi:MAG: DUF421 domain-containing protein [Clostridia bacterium]|nr:DUF421 domain-containing protein [Clostridia bacterium]MBR6523956.1 DUF421 domain-containing protein [Clostridia bacterium]
MDFVKVIMSSLLSVAALFAIAKVMGHKQMAQLDFFDYITGITIGSVAAELATELEEPWKPLVAMVIYGGASLGLTFLAHRFPKTRKFVNGTPTIVMDNGKLFRKNMKKAKLELSEFMVMCRQEGYFNINDIQTAIFEYNGRLTVLPKSAKRPIQPEDMNITPQKEKINTEVIMDGRILHDNLKRLGLDLTWLEKQLKQQKYSSAKEVYLGICDSDNVLYLFPMGD